MTRRRRMILLAASAWTLYVWVTRVAILARQDASTGFKVVHFALAAVSLGFGLAVGWIGITSRRSAGRPEGSSPEPPRPQPASPAGARRAR